MSAPTASEIVNVLSPRVTPERWAKIQAVVGRRHSHLSVGIEDIYDRGNASAVMRSMEAFGFYQLHMIELSEKFKESQRVTQGADKWIEVKKWKTTKSCVEHLKSEGRKIYVTHLDPQARALEEIDTQQPFTIFFGNEKKGASPELIALADETVFIPMRGFVQSFNISVAAAVALYGLQQRLPKEPLAPLEAERLQALYLQQSVENWETYLSHSGMSKL
jgi:tRNA (guanosine-2'-O-)-methyltransferase